MSRFEIDWEGLVVAFESRSHQITHFFDRETGEVEQVLERDANRHAAMSGNPRYVALPSDQGERSRGDLEDYLKECEDKACSRDLTGALASENSATAYRETLMRYPKEECRFFQFKERRAQQRAEAWLTSIGIAFEKPASREHPGGRTPTESVH